LFVRTNKHAEGVEKVYRGLEIEGEGKGVEHPVLF